MWSIISTVTNSSAGFYVHVQIYFKLQMGFTRWQYHCDKTTHKYISHIHNAHIAYTQVHISHKIPPLKTNKTKKNKSALKATQTVKDILQPMNTE
jgi:hypothetical protein